MANDSSAYSEMVTHKHGRIYVGTSGFSYPTWVPRFYEPGKVSRKLLVAYATRLPAVELHNTFYRKPNEQQITKWLSETPDDFRFCPKAQRSTAWRAWTEGRPAKSIAWLTDALRGFGDRLGTVLMSPRGTFERDDEQLQRVLRAWPEDIPLALELLHPSWQDDEVYEQLDSHGVTLVANDWDDTPEPDLRRIGRFVYVRLRRSSYDDAAIARWASRLEPFLADGLDAFAFFRHDEDGQMALNAEALLANINEVMAS
jgi:uncharacterized protein YecE (DUF72 family)